MNARAGTLGAVGVVLCVLVAPAVSDAAPLDPSRPALADAKTVRVGVRPDAKPFSYRKESRAAVREGILGGYGGYVIEVCREVLRELRGEGGPLGDFEVEAVEIDAANRFRMLEQGHVDMLCGPDSITRERLARYQVSFPVFLSGMTYAYLSPRSESFPRAAHCENVIGVVSGTTAEHPGLRDLAESDVLTRFDEALERELAIESRRLVRVNEMLLDITRASCCFRPGWPEPSASNHSIQRAIDAMAVDGPGGRLNKLIRDRHGTINADLAREIRTEECPYGLTGLPVRRYTNHDDGIRAFCEGKVLYYLGDYDIIRSKLSEHSGCEVVLNRFTRSREVYGIFFRQPGPPPPPADLDAIYRDGELHGEVEGKRCVCESSVEVGVPVPPDPATQVDAALLFALFNNVLFELMQGEVSRVEEIFTAEFGEERMSDDLADFFASFKILTGSSGSGG